MQNEMTPEEIRLEEETIDLALEFEESITKSLVDICKKRDPKTSLRYIMIWAFSRQIGKYLSVEQDPEFLPTLHKVSFQVEENYRELQLAKERLSKAPEEKPSGLILPGGGSIEKPAGIIIPGVTHGY